MEFRTQAQEDVLETMSLDEYLIENKEATFMMRASGDSMRSEGIFRGDLLIIDRSRTARAGDIAVVVDNGAFRMMRCGDLNTSVEELKVEAVVTAVIRKLV